MFTHRHAALMATTLGLAALAGPSPASPCSQQPVAANMEFVASFPEAGGSLPADRDAVLVFATGATHGATPESGIATREPEGFELWLLEEGSEQKLPLDIKPVNTQPHWTDVGIPSEVREWSETWDQRRVIRVFRAKPVLGWVAGAHYRIDYQVADVTGNSEAPWWEAEPAWKAQSFELTAGPFAGSVKVNGGPLEATFDSQEITCYEYCWDGADCYDCQGQAATIQRFHLGGYMVHATQKTGPLVFRFRSGGADSASPELSNRRTYLVMPGEAAPLDTAYARMGPKASDSTGEGCEVCVGISVEALDKTAQDAPEPRCFEAYGLPQPDEPCDPDDWDYEDGDEPPTPLHWPACAGNAGAGADAGRLDATGTADDAAGSVADAAGNDPATTGAARSPGCGFTATPSAGPAWLLLLLLLGPLAAAHVWKRQHLQALVR